MKPSSGSRSQLAVQSTNPCVSPLVIRQVNHVFFSVRGPVASCRYFTLDFRARHLPFFYVGSTDDTWRWFPVDTPGRPTLVLLHRCTSAFIGPQLNASPTSVPPILSIDCPSSFVCPLYISNNHYHGLLVSWKVIK